MTTAWWAESFVGLQGIPSEEAFGGGSVGPGAISVLMPGIASGEMFGGTTVIGPGQNLIMAGIPSAEAFGGSTVSPGAATVGMFGKTSDEAFGNMTLTRGPVDIVMSGIPSAEAFGAIQIPVQVGFASASAGNLGFNFALQWNHTVAVGDYVIVQVETSQATISTVNLAGTAMTPLFTAIELSSGSGVWHGWYGLKITSGIGAGSKAITVTTSTNTEVIGRSASYTNVVSVSAAQITSGTGTALSQTVTCNATERIVQGFVARNGSAGGVTFSSLVGGTNRYAHTYSRTGFTLSDAVANTTFTGTASPTGPWAGVAVVLKAV